MEPWTQRIRFRWRPTLAFYERRYELLRSFEDANLLRQFRVQDSSVATRLGDPRHLLVFGTDRLELGVLKPDGDVDRLAAAARQVFEALQPSRLAKPTMAFQWLGLVDGDYEEAKHAALARTLAAPALGTYEDFALLLDGAIEEPQARYRCEVGVVEAAELPRRLSREQGRVGDRELGAPSTLWAPESLPAVALFCDSEWNLTTAPDASADALIEVWSSARRAAGRVVSGLFDHLGAVN